MLLRLGNLSVQQIEKRIGLEFSQELRNFLNTTHSNSAEFKNSQKWHCFDIPFTIVCSSKEFADKLLELLLPYGKSMDCQLGITWHKKGGK